MQRFRVWRLFGERILRHLLHRCQAQRHAWSCTPPHVRPEEIAPRGVCTGLQGVHVVSLIKNTLEASSVAVFEMPFGDSAAISFNMG